MNCHVIMDTYMDDDVDTTSAHLWTGQNLRWANFWPNFSYFRSSFSAILASRFQLLFSPNSSPIFNALLSPLLNHIQPIYTAQFRTYDPYTQPMYTAYTTNNCSSTSNKKYYVFIQHHITWIFIQHQIQHLAVLDIHQHTAVPDIHQNKCSNHEVVEVHHQQHFKRWNLPPAKAYSITKPKKKIRHRRESWKPDGQDNNVNYIQYNTLNLTMNSGAKLWTFCIS